MKKYGVALLVLALFAQRLCLAEEQFRKLSSDEIRKRVVGKEVTDDSYWADRILPDGTASGSMQGHHRTGRWEIAHDEICMIYPDEDGPKCYEMWAKGDEYQYRQDGALFDVVLIRPIR